MAYIFSEIDEQASNKIKKKRKRAKENYDHFVFILIINYWVGRGGIRQMGLLALQVQHVRVTS